VIVATTSPTTRRIVILSSERLRNAPWRHASKPISAVANMPRTSIYCPLFISVRRYFVIVSPMVKVPMARSMKILARKFADCGTIQNPFWA